MSNPDFSPIYLVSQPDVKSSPFGGRSLLVSAAVGGGSYALFATQPANAQAVDPVAQVTTGIASLSTVVGTVITLGVSVLIATAAFGIVRKII